MIEIYKTENIQMSSAIYDVLRDVYETSPWTIAQIEADFESPQIWYGLAMLEEQVLGFLAVQETEFEAEVLQIAVKKAHQGQGLARKLFALLPPNKEIFLEVRESNIGAQLFYQKENFKEIARRKGYYHSPIEDAIMMKREINER